MGGNKNIDQRQCGIQTVRRRFIVVHSQQWIQPNNLASAALDLLQLLPK